jgi:hypothetical protein
LFGLWNAVRARRQGCAPRASRRGWIAPFLELMWGVTTPVIDGDRDGSIHRVSRRHGLCNYISGHGWLLLALIASQLLGGCPLAFDGDAATVPDQCTLTEHAPLFQIPPWVTFGCFLPSPLALVDRCTFVPWQIPTQQRGCGPGLAAVGTTTSTALFFFWRFRLAFLYCYGTRHRRFQSSSLLSPSRHFCLTFPLNTFRVSLALQSLHPDRASLQVVGHPLSVIRAHLTIPTSGLVSQMRTIAQ